MRFWDAQDVMQKLVLEFTYRFDDVLDAEKLKSSLERLLEIEGWRGLGARFKKIVSGHFSQRKRARWSVSRLTDLSSKRPESSSITYPSSTLLSDRALSGLKRLSTSASLIIQWRRSFQQLLGSSAQRFIQARISSMSL